MIDHHEPVARHPEHAAHQLGRADETRNAVPPVVLVRVIAEEGEMGAWRGTRAGLKVQPPWQQGKM